MASQLAVSTLNVNGLNELKKQMKLVHLMHLYKIHVIFIQEYNLKKNGDFAYIKKFCHVFINFTNHHKGETAIIIDKNANLNVLSCEYDANGLITSVKCQYFNATLLLVNVLGHNFHWPL